MGFTMVGEWVEQGEANSPPHYSEGFFSSLGLSDRHVYAFVRVRLDGERQADVAEELGVSQSRVSQLISDTEETLAEAGLVVTVPERVPAKCRSFPPSYFDRFPSR